MAAGAPRPKNRAPKAALSRRGQRVRYAERFSPDDFFEEERTPLEEAANHPDPDVREMARQALDGDTSALFMLHDALLDAGEEGMARDLIDIMGYVARRDSIRRRNNPGAPTPSAADQAAYAATNIALPQEPLEDRARRAIGAHMQHRPQSGRGLPLGPLGVAREPEKLSKRPRRVRYADRIGPEMFGDQEAYVLAQLADWPDPDISQLARDAQQGDVTALYLLHDALLDYQGRYPDHQAQTFARLLRPLMSSAARIHPSGAGVNPPAAKAWDEAYAGVATGRIPIERGQADREPADDAAIGWHMLNRPKKAQASGEGQVDGRAPSASRLRGDSQKLSKRPRRARYGALRSPAGGVVVRGIHYPGGKYIPAKGPEKAHHDQWTAVQNQIRYQRADGSYDYQAACDEKDRVRYMHPGDKAFLDGLNAQRGDNLGTTGVFGQGRSEDIHPEDVDWSLVPSDEIFPEQYYPALDGDEDLDTKAPSASELRDQRRYATRRGRKINYATSGFPSSGTQLRTPWGFPDANAVNVLGNLAQFLPPQARGLIDAVMGGQHDALIPLFDAAQEFGAPADLIVRLGEFVRQASSLSASPAVLSGQWEESEPTPFEAAYRGEDEALGDYQGWNQESGRPAAPSTDQMNWAHNYGTAAAAGQYLNTRSGWPQQ